MIDYTKIQLVSAASSNKVLKEGSGGFVVPALGGIGDVFGSATIPHGFNSDNLLCQVTTTGGGIDSVMLPWQSNDGRVTQYTALDSTNLYITVISSDSGGGGALSFAINYYYRILIP